MHILAYLKSVYIEIVLEDESIGKNFGRQGIVDIAESKKMQNQYRILSKRLSFSSFLNGSNVRLVKLLGVSEEIT